VARRLFGGARTKHCSGGADGYANPTTGEGIAAGFDDHITKPLDFPW